MILPFDAPVDTHFDEKTGPTYTYRWGAIAVGTNSLSQFGRETGVILIPGALFIGVLGVLILPKPHGWLVIGMAGALLLLGIAMTFQKRVDVRNAPIERLIRIHYGRGIVEFRFCPFYENFWRQTVIDHYECPLDNLTAFEMVEEKSGGPYRRAAAIMRIWTSRGYLRISGAIPYLEKLDRALTIIAGERPAPLLQRGWVIMAIGFLAAGALIVVLWHFNII